MLMFQPVAPSTGVWQIAFNQQTHITPRNTNKETTHAHVQT